MQSMPLVTPAAVRGQVGFDPCFVNEHKPEHVQPGTLQLRPLFTFLIDVAALLFCGKDGLFLKRIPSWRNIFQTVSMLTVTPFCSRLLVHGVQGHMRFFLQNR